MKKKKSKKPVAKPKEKPIEKPEPMEIPEEPTPGEKNGILPGPEAEG